MIKKVIVKTQNTRIVLEHNDGTDTFINRIWFTPFGSAPSTEWEPLINTSEGRDDNVFGELSLEQVEGIITRCREHGFDITVEGGDA